MVFQLKLVDEKSKEADFARHALFTKHPEMKGKIIIFLHTEQQFFC